MIRYAIEFWGIQVCYGGLEVKHATDRRRGPAILNIKTVTGCI